MSKLNAYIKRLARHIRRHPKTLLTWFDDAGGVRIDDEYILVKVDGFAVSRAKYPWCSYKDFSFKAVGATVSDVYTKGCRPTIYAISIGVTPNSVDFLEEITRGIEEAVRLYGGYVENIDTNIGSDIWIDVFVIALCKYLPIPRRARVGDAIVILKKVGLSSIAYREYLKGGVPRDKEVLDFSCRPTVDNSLIDTIESLRPCIIGSIDISDTIYETLAHLVDLSNVGIYIDANISELLHAKALNYAYSESVDILEMFLEANEEYTPILVVDRLYVEQVVDIARAKGLYPQIIGLTTSSTEITWRGAKIKKYLWDYELGKIVKA